jgi:hypothetical protein
MADLMAHAVVPSGTPFVVHRGERVSVEQVVNPRMKHWSQAKYRPTSGGWAGMVVNVVCLKWGTKYSPDYVNKLAAMVRRNLSRPHRFVCLTEDRTGVYDSIKCLPLPDEDLGLTGWWHKLSLFCPEVHDLAGPTLFPDLDIVITGVISTYCSNIWAISASSATGPTGAGEAASGSRPRWSHE